MREARIDRKTKETEITVRLSMDGVAKAVIETGIGFFDHMLTAFAIHSGIDLAISVKGDLDVDCHHTIEDTGIVLGLAAKLALGDKGGIERYGWANIPMDEALGSVSLDISGRPYLVFDGEFKSDSVGSMDTQMVEEFFRAFCYNAGITLHAKVTGTNDHHKIEALFKALAHAFKQAIVLKVDGSVLSTKGVL